MKLRKLLAVTAVAATMTAAFAVNAMAETPNKFTNFKYEDGVITLNADAEAEQIPVQSAGPYTMLVVRVDDTGLADTEIADTDIKQIDQADAPFTTINVGDLTAVSNCAECTANKAEKCSHTRTYEIRLGGDGQVRWGTLEVGGAPTYTVGDINGVDNVNAIDANLILRYCAKMMEFDSTQMLAGDVNGVDNVNAIDANLVLRYCAKMIDKFPVEK